MQEYLNSPGDIEHGLLAVDDVGCEEGVDGLS